MRKLVIILLVVALTFGVAAGCAKQSYGVSEESMAYDAVEQPAMEMKNESLAVETQEAEAGRGVSDGMDAEAISLQTDRKLIYRAYYSIETITFDKDYALIMAKLKSAGGYAQNTWTDGTKPAEYGDRGRRAELSLRVPFSAYDEFILSLEGVGNILSKSQNTDDVSAQYFDTEARIRVLNTQLERLEKLLERAEKLEDIIILEQEITNVMYELDRYQGQKRQLDNLIDYTTVTITLVEVNEISTIAQGEEGLGQRIAESFENVMDGLERFFSGLIVIIVGGAPAWLIIGAIVAFVVVLVKRRRLKKAKKADEKPAPKKTDKKAKPTSDYHV